MTESNPYYRFQKDYDLEPLSDLPLLGEYLEMVLQYGFVIMFSAAFPLAPLFALMNNVAEIRVDAQKYICNSRRALPEKASGILAICPKRLRAITVTRDKSTLPMTFE